MAWTPKPKPPKLTVSRAELMFAALDGQVHTHRHHGDKVYCWNSQRVTNLALPLSVAGWIDNDPSVAEGPVTVTPRGVTALKDLETCFGCTRYGIVCWPPNGPGEAAHASTVVCDNPRHIALASRWVRLITGTCGMLLPDHRRRAAAPTPAGVGR